MLLSVLIPVYKQHPARLLHDLVAQIQFFLPGEVEVLVGDDSADAAESAWHTQYPPLDFPWLHIYRHPHNLGRSKGRNFLIEQAKGRYIWFLDGDVTIQPGLLQAYVQQLTQFPAVWCSGIGCPDDAPDNLRNWYTRNVETRTADERNKAPYRSFSAANFAMPRQWAEKVRFPAAHQGYGHEDTHFGLQLLSVGIAVHHFDLPVWHGSNESDAQYLVKIKESTANLARLYRTEKLFQKHRNELRLIRSWEPLQLLGMAFFISLLSPLFEKQLLQGKRSLRLLQLYKLGCFDRYFRTRIS